MNRFLFPFRVGLHVVQLFPRFLQLDRCIQASVHPFILGKAHDPDFQPQADHPVTNFQKVGGQHLSNGKWPPFFWSEGGDGVTVLCYREMPCGRQWSVKNGWKSKRCCQLQFCVTSVGCTIFMQRMKGMQQLHQGWVSNAFSDGAAMFVFFFDQLPRVFLFKISERCSDFSMQPSFRRYLRVRVTWRWCEINEAPCGEIGGSWSHGAHPGILGL